MTTITTGTTKAWHLIAAGTLAGILSVALLPIETLAPVRLTMPVAVFRALALIQPTLLAMLALWAGQRLGPRVGLGRAPLLDAVLAGGDWRAVLRQQLPAAVAVGVLTGGIVWLWGAEVLPRLATDADAVRRIAGFAMPLVTRLLYGGIAEEVLLRWGLMSFFAWGLWRLAGRPARPGDGLIIAAILLSALLFGAGHLPLLFGLNPHPPAWGIAVVIGVNALIGVALGWLYWRRGIEAAMLAHALGHVIAVLAG